MRHGHDAHRMCRKEAKAHLYRRKAALTCQEAIRQDSIRSSQDKDHTCRSQDLILSRQDSNSIHRRDSISSQDSIGSKEAKAQIYHPKDSIRAKEANLIGIGPKTPAIQSHVDYLSACEFNGRCLLPILQFGLGRAAGCVENHAALHTITLVSFPFIRGGVYHEQAMAFGGRYAGDRFVYLG